MSLASAIVSGDPGELPSRRQEDWHWTDLRGLLRSIPAPPAVFHDPLPEGPFAGAGESITIVNGEGPSHLSVADGETRIIQLRIVSAGQAGACASRLGISVGEGSRLLLFQSHEALDDGHVSEFDLDLKLIAGAEVERVILMADMEQSITVSDAEVSMAPGARFGQTVLTTGARRQRIETRVTHPGCGAEVRLDGAYLMKSSRHADLTTRVVHTGREGSTIQLAKGVAHDQGRAVFQGRITVMKGADHVDARMGHHALLLSDRAEVDAKPELEIFADEVSCTHGNTVGSLDDDAIFYASQRGIPEDEVRRMLTAAFVGEVLDRIVNDHARQVARTWLEQNVSGSPA